ncbi:MAG: TonB-dependent receptor plug domain-containing protein, partial [Bacteroidota bacterium]|nr:TonB-dependent receptor plug domain-containing protein [Bacteroidota bacterium]
MKFCFTFLAFVFLFAIGSKGQNRLSGSIYEVLNHKPLSGARVSIHDLNLSAISDSLGNYVISGIPRGVYAVEVSAAGYTAQIPTIVFKGPVKKDYLLAPAFNQLKEVVVTGVINATEKKHTPYAIATVGQADLLQDASTNVIDAIAKLPGVSAITGGQSISKPIIRGLGYNRVLTVNDGVQQVDQAWFDEFGIEADPDGVSRYEILKGPASLAFGSDAIAGVINLIPEQPLPEGQVKGTVLFNYQTNNGLLNNMLHLAGTKNGVSWSARIDNTMAHAYRNPNDGYVLNSQFSNFNVDGTISLHRRWGYTQLHASYFDMHTGIVDGTRDSTSGVMERQVAYPGLNGGAPTYVLPTRQEQTGYTPFVIDQWIQ